MPLPSGLGQKSDHSSLLLSSDPPAAERAMSHAAGRLRLQQLRREHASEQQRMAEAVQDTIKLYFSHGSRFEEICRRLEALEKDMDAVEPGLFEEVRQSLEPHAGLEIHDPKLQSTRMLIAVSHIEVVTVEIGPVQVRQPGQQHGGHGADPARVKEEEASPGVTAAAHGQAGLRPEGDSPTVHDPATARLQAALEEVAPRYRIVQRIGEGTFSTVYKAEDLQADHLAAAGVGRHVSAGSVRRASYSRSGTSPRPKFVAIKNIHSTSSPTRVCNELEFLNSLRGRPCVCPLIAAHRSGDQLIAVIPYFQHCDFGEFLTDVTVPEIAEYCRQLFTALSAVHRRGIIHRDVKPDNFLYNAETRQGLLIDFGLAERQREGSPPCSCTRSPSTTGRKPQASGAARTRRRPGYPRYDTRPTRTASRAGTGGFRAPEVLFRCTAQSGKIDIWSAGTILLSMLTRRLPFFKPADDIDAMVDIVKFFGYSRTRAAGLQHGVVVEASLFDDDKGGLGLEDIIQRSNKCDGDGHTFSTEERTAIDFLSWCLELNPHRRTDADAALQHKFLSTGATST